jgi:uncharacterized protein
MPVTHRLPRLVADHRLLVVVTALLMTAALAVPLLTMAPEEFASQEPAGPIFTARDALDERFGAGSTEWFFIVEARDGEMLDRDSLLAAAQRVEALRADPVLGAMLLKRTDPRTGQVSVGARSFADVVDGVLVATGAGGLEDADPAVVRQVASAVIDAEGAAALGISSLAVRDETSGLWSAPAMTLSVAVDTTALDGRGNGGGFGSDAALEGTAREVQAVLRDGDALDVVGVALDQNLTGEEQGQAAGPFIGFTVLAIVALVGLVFRSYWTLAVVGAALASLLVWLQGLANLIGLKEDQILSTVVPIAMISFGVDYAFHAVGRYREERAAGARPHAALGAGLGGVMPALALALGTGVLAFLANTTSGIESITQLGVAAALALSSAFLVLGIVVPAAIALIDERVQGRTVRGRRVLSVGGGIAAASMAMATVLFAVFLAPPVGLGLLVGYVIVFLLVPLAIAGRLPRAKAIDRPAEAVGRGGFAHLLGRAVTAVAARRVVVLPLVGVLSIGAAVLALQVPASFDVEDFFAPDTDFVVGLDALDEHVGAQGGEEAVILIESDLTDAAVLTAVEAFVDRIGALEGGLLARGGDGRVEVDRSALAVLEGTSLLSSTEAERVVALADGTRPMAARLSVGLVGSRAQENVAAARELLEPLVDQLGAEIAALHPGSRATLTGGPIVRQASLEAVSRSLQTSLPVAIVLCLLVAWVAMRSLRYALVSLVPIVLVVAWLYGFMEVAGYSINLVTATIGAISIGIGIDFAIHVTMRYREELTSSATRMAALDRTVAGTGVALVGSTASSVIGFAILAFAPMPLFASYGLLTAVMIALALLASLLVLPGLLLLVSREPRPPEASDPPLCDLAVIG